MKVRAILDPGDVGPELTTPSTDNMLSIDITYYATYVSAEFIMHTMKDET